MAERPHARTPGIVHASTTAGVELPVIDITHPAFAVTATETELEVLADAFVAEAERRRLPRWLYRLILRAFLRRSVLGRGLLAASGTYVTGLHTYLMKLGPDNLGPSFTAVDRRIAGSFPAIAMRVRLQDVARLLADGLSASLSTRTEAPLALVDIAGGPAVDALNALILLRREQPHVLTGRSIAVIVLDSDADGPAFGGRALAALVAPGAPLAGLDVTFRHVRYDWHDTDVLRAELDALQDRDAVWAVSSEGGLFEYGDDESIVRNLAVLAAAAPADTVVAGSVTRDARPARAALASTRVPTRPRSLEEFRDLARHGGWTLDRAVTRALSFQVRLART